MQICLMTSQDTVQIYPERVEGWWKYKIARIIVLKRQASFII